MKYILKQWIFFFQTLFSSCDHCGSLVLIYISVLKHEGNNSYYYYASLSSPTTKHQLRTRISEDCEQRKELITDGCTHSSIHSTHFTTSPLSAFSFVLCAAVVLCTVYYHENWVRLAFFSSHTYSAFAWVSTGDRSSYKGGALQAL